jgi:hypothetical protein
MCVLSTSVVSTAGKYHQHGKITEGVGGSCAILWRKIKRYLE